MAGLYHRVTVILEEGKANKIFYVYQQPSLNNALVKASITVHNFNFSIGKADSSEDPEPEDVESIEVTANPNTEYFEGQRFNPVGMVVTATLKEGGASTIAGYKVLTETGGERLSTSDTYVTISFGEGEHKKTATLQITVQPTASISNVTIENGQMFGEWDFKTIEIGFDLKRKVDAYDAVTWHGQKTGRFSFRANEEATVTADNNVTFTTEGGIFSADLPSSEDGTKTTVTVTVDGSPPREYAFTCYEQKYSGMPVEVVEYFPVASQYTNGSMWGSYGLNPISTLRGKELDASVGDMYYGPTSLGNLGGYIVYRYAEPIEDDPNNPYGVDFLVYPNNYAANKGYSEPGSVLVAEAAEGPWYTLAGSSHYEDIAKWNVSVTYTNNYGFADWSAEWEGGSNSGSGAFGYPDERYYPLFKWDDDARKKVTLTGVLSLSAAGADEYGTAAARFPDFGYADTGMRGTSNEAGNPYKGQTNSKTIDRVNGFDLKWAVDEQGQPVDLSDRDICFVKIQTANNVASKTLGEKSTEINGVRIAEPDYQAVGVTDAPSEITVDGKSVSLGTDSIVTIGSIPVTGAFTVNVEVPDNETNVYINGLRDTTRSFTEMPDHKMLRVIVQKGEKEPRIYYMNLVDGGGIDNSTVVTFDANGGLLTDPVDGSEVGTLKMGFTPDMPESAWKFPEPTMAGADFDGWIDEKGDKYSEYDDKKMPETLELKAKWKYDTKTIKLDAAGGWFTADEKRVQSAVLPFANDTPDSERKFPEPTRGGYKFLGWYWENIRFTAYTNTMYDGLELKARWEASAAVSQDEIPGQDDSNSVVDTTDPETPAVVVEISSGNDSFNPSTGVETVTVTPGSITDAIDQAVTVAAVAGSDPVIVIKAASAGSAVREVRVDIPVADLDAVAKNGAGELNVKIESAAGEITLNKAAVNDLVAEAGDAETVEAVIEHKAKGDLDLTEGQRAAVSDGKVREVYDVSLYADGLDRLDGFRTSGRLTVGLPYALGQGEAGAGVLVRYVREDGYTEPMTEGRRYDGGKKQAVFRTNHLSIYAVTYDPAYAGGGAEDTETGGSPDSGGGYDEGYDG
ncbi:MAG: hypothetical protein LBL73_01940, partial [Synergistaceae bacterium]|nr:hypothetical protein [Synergistaceae bacterium]